jgi:signal transduction histidine kinase
VVVLRQLWLSNPVSPHTARIAVLPREVASEVITGAVSRAGWAVAITVLVMDAVVVLDTVSTRSGAQFAVVPLLAIVGLLCLLAYMGAARSTLSRVVFLGAGGALAVTYQVSLLTIDPGLNESAVYVVNRPAFVLVIGVAGMIRPLAGLAWGAVGYIVAMASLLVGTVIAGLPFTPGWGPTVALAMYSSAYLVLAGIRASHASQLPDLRRLEMETQRLDLENQYEQRAAALIHDTVLNDLTVVMNSNGPLHEAAIARFRADVATLADASWLRESRDTLALDPQDSALRNGMVALASELQWRGLSVDVTGNPDDVVSLSPEKVAAVHAAVRACLENVLQHSGVQSAELVLGAEQDSASVMVIDHGAGFDVSSVAPDRLGLRSSVVRRIEQYGGSVRVWSTPGSGTSVLLTMPREAQRGEAPRVD